MHHAYLFFGSLKDLPALGIAARAKFKFKKPTSIGGDPDVVVRAYEKFGIEEARELQSMNALRSVSGRALYIVGVGAITTEAQQALLKLFEEPQEGVIYILLAPHGSIISTLRSRFMAWEEGSATGLASDSRSFARGFLLLSQKSRSDEIAKMLKDEEGVRERVREFLSGLEMVLHSSLSKSKDKKQIYEGLEDIAKVRSYANDRSPSLKMLLEHLAVALPTLK